MVLLLLRARRKDDVDGLIREARRSWGEHLLERWAPGKGIKSHVKDSLSWLCYSSGLCNVPRIPLGGPAASFKGWLPCWGRLFSLLFGQVLDIEGAESA